MYPHTIGKKSPSHIHRVDPAGSRYHRNSPSPATVDTDTVASLNGESPRAVSVRLDQIWSAEARPVTLSLELERVCESEQGVFEDRHLQALGDGRAPLVPVDEVSLTQDRKMPGHRGLRDVEMLRQLTRGHGARAQ
jgi:hypothetical protein